MRGSGLPDLAEKYLTMDHESGELVLKELNGEYVSVWENGKEYRSPCTVNIRDRTIEIEQTHDADDDGALVREYIVLDGKEYEAAAADMRDEYLPEDRADMFFWK